MARDTFGVVLYQGSDWERFSAPDPGYLPVRDHRVPYAVFDNEPEKTDKPELLGRHLGEVCARRCVGGRRRTCSTSSS
jgi:hypothetical protein